MIAQQELTIKTLGSLEIWSKHLIANQVESVCLTSKKDNLNCFEVVEILRSYIPDLKFTLNYSLNENYDRSYENMLQRFNNFIKSSLVANIDQILLISGNPKRKIDTLFILKQFETLPLPFAIAYNPFLQSTEEELRLEAKLKHRNVKSVYFQLGDNLEILKNSIDKIKSCHPNHKIYISILQPTLSKLNNFKFRPWHGVFYSENYLSDISFALEKTRQIEALVEKHNCNILYS